MRTCRKCGIEKPLESFPKNKAVASGHVYNCKVCTNARRRELALDPLRKTRVSYLESDRRAAVEKYLAGVR